MTTRRVFVSGTLALLVMATACVCPMSRAADKTDTQSAERAVTYKRMGAGDYQNFLKNWDEKKQAVLYALIQTPAQYAVLFHPAPLMGDKRPFAPAAEVYAKEQILLVARVIVAPGNMAKVFEVERVTERDQELAFHYRFNEPKTNATYFVKNCLAVRIPRRDYRKVTLFENGKQIGELKPAEGQWAVPAGTPEPNGPDAGEGK
ncbi:MAG: hypothetical protein WCK89_00240 [bacterium]